MQSMTIRDVRSWLLQDAVSLKITEDGSLYFHNEIEPSFAGRYPLEYRRLVALAHDFISLSDASLFEGGLIWLRQWQVGVSELARPGWRMIEDMRRAHGDLRSLELAPGQLFRQDEFVELHAYLVQVMAHGWGAYFVAATGDYLLELTTGERFVCRAESSERLGELYASLQSWGLSWEDAHASDSSVE